MPRAVSPSDGYIFRHLEDLKLKVYNKLQLFIYQIPYCDTKSGWLMIKDTPPKKSRCFSGRFWVVFWEVASLKPSSLGFKEEFFPYPLLPGPFEPSEPPVRFGTYPGEWWSLGDTKMTSRRIPPEVWCFSSVGKFGFSKFTSCQFRPKSRFFVTEIHGFSPIDTDRLREKNMMFSLKKDHSEKGKILSQETAADVLLLAGSWFSSRHFEVIACIWMLQSAFRSAPFWACICWPINPLQPQTILLAKLLSENLRMYPGPWNEQTRKSPWK